MKPTRRNVLKALVVAAAGAGMREAPAQQTSAEWLILVYMNGKNNLVNDALGDFKEMASVGSTDQVSVVVQLGRPELHNPPTHDGWSGIKRYHVKKATTPNVANALMNVAGPRDPEGDMGSPATLNDFIEWGVAKFPARRRMLVIWNHGQGWRFQAHPSNTRFSASSRALTEQEVESMSDAPVVGNYRSVSSDDDHHSILYNKQVQTTLEAQMRKGTRFDIVAYDACLMSMVETAYSLRRCTDFLVASEELEPGAGWQHDFVLKKLVTDPKMDAERLARAVVASYQERYGNDDMTTLAAMRLSGIEQVAQSISSAAKALMSSRQVSYPVLTNVRGSLKAFADYYGIGYSVDCESLFERLAAASGNSAVKASAVDVVKAMKSILVANYASDELKAYSPRGLALYFPGTRADFMRDPDRNGYLKSNTVHPVDFVSDMEWSSLLRDYLQLC